MRQRYYYTRAFPKVKPQKRFYQKRRRAEAPRPARQRISETMLSTAWSTATPSLWILFPTCVFMGSLPQGIIIPTMAPAIIPAPMPAQNPDCRAGHQPGADTDPKSGTHSHLQSLLCGLSVV